MTALFFLNGQPAGSIQFPSTGVPLVTGGAWNVLARLPFPIFPFLDSKSALHTLHGMPHEIQIPGLGVLHTEMLR